jgi:xanthine dehydrogenase large subunit
VKQNDIFFHGRGETLFTDDLDGFAGLLHAAVLPSPVARGRVVRLDTDAARQRAGVRAVFTAADIPGENQIGGIIADEPLLAAGEVHYVGQPLALVVADTPRQARQALAAIRAEIEELPPVLDPRLAAAQGLLIIPPRVFALGDVDNAWPGCALVVEGRVDSGGQEHLYLETQAAVAVAGEKDTLRVISATQSPTVVQRTVARVLGLPMSQVSVEVFRLGGAFGGKEDQATPWAVLAALAARALRRPVKLVLNRQEDMRLTGKRHPYSSDFKIGLDGSGRILAYEVTYYQNAGAAADLSTAILERTLFHAGNSYRIPNVRATGISCRTNLPPFTAFRGFGAPQAMFVLEAALFQAAEKMGVAPAALQEMNLLAEGDEFPYGQKAKNCRARRCWREAVAAFDLPATRERVRAYNAAHPLSKKGLALMPVCFGISFTTAHLNQAAALVHVYTDGSVSVSTAAVEMGQGVNNKVLLVAARALGVAQGRLRMESTCTRRVANTSPTAASTGADLNGRAAELACAEIRGRLLKVAAAALAVDGVAGLDIRQETVFHDGKKTDLTWDKLVQAAFFGRVNLSAQAHYAPPGLHFDRAQEKGEPFAYHVYGTALVEATVDCLRGTCTVDAVRAVHDAGDSLNPLVDRGQAEGGIVQGIGWMTLEELVYSDKGRLLTDSLSTYKLPDIRTAPAEIDVRFLQDAPNPAAVLNSKAVGEPPFMYGIGAYFALLAALRALRPLQPLTFSAPLTNEKILGWLEEK